MFAIPAELDAWVKSATGRKALAEPSIANGALGGLVKATLRDATPEPGRPLPPPSPEPDHSTLSAAFTQPGPAPVGHMSCSIPAIVLAASLMVALVLLLVPLEFTNGGPTASSVGSSASQTTPIRQSVRIGLTFEDGHVARVGIGRNGYAIVGTGTAGPHSFSAEVTDDGVRLHISKMVEADPNLTPHFRELTAVSLKLGSPVQLSEIPGLKSIELLPPNAPAPVATVGATGSR